MAKYDDIVNYKSKTNLENGVLINKLGLQNEEELEKAERMITNYKLAKLYLEEQQIQFTVPYYLNIHKYLFDQIYPFAGEIRSEVIEKRIPFCLPHLIHENLSSILNKAQQLASKIKDEEMLIDSLAYLYSELDIIHAFREGNGRVQREFLRQFVNYVNKNVLLENYKLDYSLIPSDQKEGLINAVVYAEATCELGPLKEYMKMALKNEKLENKPKSK